MKDTLTFSVSVKNTGKMTGDKMVQAYIPYLKPERIPLKELKEFKRFSVNQGGEQIAEIKIPGFRIAKVEPAKASV